jgi:hypothetical protein
VFVLCVSRNTQTQEDKSTGIYRNIQEYTGIYRNIQVYTGIYRHIGIFYFTGIFTGK